MSRNDLVIKIPIYIIIIGFASYIGVILIDIFFRDESGFGNLYIQILGVIMLLFGVTFSMIARINLRRSYHFLPKAKKLVTNGLYKWFKHPVYIGNLIFLIGFAILLGSTIGLTLTLVLLIPVHVVRARYEEQILARTFKDEYLRYKKQTIF